MERMVHSSNGNKKFPFSTICSVTSPIHGVFTGNWIESKPAGFQYTYALSEEFQKWASETFVGDYQVVTVDLLTATIEFEKSEDLVMFNLTWK